MQLYLESFKTFNKLVDLGMTFTQLGAVSAQTIFYRSAYMQQGAATPHWQEKEAKTMTLEKVDAMQEGTQLLWKGWLETNQSILSATQQNMSRINKLAMSGTSMNLISTQFEIIKVTKESASDGFKLGHHIIDTLERSIKPAYSYASGNAIRLSVKKAR